MKYYTKEWFCLMQNTGSYKYFRRIPDGTYTTKDIEQMYQKELKKELAENPDDPELTALFFEQGYRGAIKYVKTNYPEWLSEEVDKRLIALRFLPATAYNKYRQFVKDCTREWNRINRAGESAMKRQNIATDIWAMFSLHDSCLLSLQKKGKNLVLDFKRDGLWPEGEGYRRLTLIGAEILEKDPHITTRKTYDEQGPQTSTQFLYHELYRTKHGYEVHLMFATRTDLAYLTVRCDDIVSRDYGEFNGYKCPSMDEEISFEVDIEAVKEQIKEDIKKWR